MPELRWYINQMRLSSFLLFTTVLSATVSVSPQKDVVVSNGGVVHFKAGESVTWSLAPGSAGTIDPDGTYHAPASIPVKNKLGGCQVLGNDHIFNSRIDKLPVDQHSAAWMALIPQSGLGYYPGWGFNVGDKSTPKRAMHFLYTPQNDGQFEMVQWPNLKRENGVFSDPHSDVDRHEITIDRDTCDIYEIYNSYDPGTTKGCPTCTGQSGFHYRNLSSALPSGSIDAAGLLLTPLTLGLGEIREGAIEHALRVTFKNNIIAHEFVWPARTNAGAWGKIPYGTRFRLKRSFDTSKFQGYSLVLLQQLKEYGLVLADGGGNWDISTYTDVTEDPAVEDALGDVQGRGPKTSDFEIVDESSLMASNALGGVKENNEFVSPEGYATVIATTTKDSSNITRVRVVLQGITIGVPDPAAWVQSGVQTQFTSWVNGTSDKRVRWSMSPPLGNLTPEGRYTAPDVQHPTSTLFTATSVLDPKALARVAVTVMPKGAIRIAVGNGTRAPDAPSKAYPNYGPDSEGNMWWRNQGGEVSWGVVNDDWYGEPWPKTKDIQLLYTSRYSLGDMVYKFKVANGHYKISLLFAQPQCKTTFPKGWRVPFHIETQGKIVVPNFDMGAGINYACLTPVTESFPAVVSDNSLYFALRRVTSGKDTPSPILSAFAVERDESAPHLTVTPGKVATLSLGQQIQFKTIGWNMDEKAKWAVVKGPGTVSSDGLYSAPASPPKSDQPVVLQAMSIADPSKTVSAEMTFKFGAFALSPGESSLVRSLSQQFTPYIDGVKYSNVNWSMQPKLGTITPDGIYTAPDTLPSDTKVTITAESKEVTGKSASAVIDLKAKPDPIRVDCGGTGSFKDAQGNVWAADYGFSPMTIAYHENTPIARASSDMQSLYQSARYRYAKENFSYQFALPNGRYAVTLKFADYTFKEPGHYNFDGLINGQQVLTSFDFDTVYGPRTAVDKRFETTVTDKNVTIEFRGHQSGASVNGLEILPLAN